MTLGHRLQIEVHHRIQNIVAEDGQGDRRGCPHSELPVTRAKYETPDGERDVELIEELQCCRLEALRDDHWADGLEEEDPLVMQGQRKHGRKKPPPRKDDTLYEL